MSKREMILVITFVILVIGIGCFFLLHQRSISLEEVKKKLLLTQKIEVEKDLIVTHEKITYPIIEDKETIKEIITLLSNTYPTSKGWTTGTEHDIYYLKLFDKRNELIATIQIDSLPWEIKGRRYHYKLDSDLENAMELKKVLEKKCDIILP